MSEKRGLRIANLPHNGPVGDGVALSSPNLPAGEEERINDYVAVRIRCGFRIDPVTGEKLPLTPEQEAWGDKMLDHAFRGMNERS